MYFTTSETLDADERSAMPHENPFREGLQALTDEQRDALIDYLESTYEKRRRMHTWLTSSNIAKHATRSLRKMGVGIKVTNLMVKSALHLLGFEYDCDRVLIRHYRIGIHDEHDKGA